MTIGSTKPANRGIDALLPAEIGGYGHSRFREFVFGGVTRLMLNKMPVPVLMAH